MLGGLTAPNGGEPAFFLSKESLQVCKLNLPLGGRWRLHHCGIRECTVLPNQ
jgi:hypothetical protein